MANDINSAMDFIKKEVENDGEYWCGDRAKLAEAFVGYADQKMKEIGEISRATLNKLMQENGHF